jgi:2-methylaconitate cis-trans-isomerase PrpF
VAPDQAKIDMTGNCGNIASGVGPFALDEGIVKAIPGQTEVRTLAFQ